MNIREIIYGDTDTGKIRTNNEDRFIAEPVWDDNHLLAVVIDGVGGHKGGEKAAEIARHTIKTYLSDNFNGEEGRLLREAVNDANTAIYNASLEVPEFSNMSCVLTACIINIQKGLLSWCHVGDTRLYVYENGELKKLSHDHSLVGYREEIGDLSEEEAMNHPQRNIINRDVGSAPHRLDDEDFIESGSYETNEKCVVLLCSDGLSDMLTSKQIKACIRRTVSLEERCKIFIAEANKKGGGDNITLVLADIPPRAKRNVNNTNEAEETKAEPVTGYADHQDQVPDNPGRPAVKKVKRPRWRNLFILSVIVVSAYFIWLFAGNSRSKQLNGKNKLNEKDVLRNSAGNADSLNIHSAIQKAQESETGTFSYATDKKDSIIKITMPVIIYKDSFKWVQKNVLYIEPADSMKNPVGLILSGKGLIIKNVVFRRFTTDSVIARKR